MFRIENNVPEVYVQESRDFQLLSRLYDLALQASRFSIDSMSSVSDSLRCNDNILPLLSTKVGFFTKTQFTDKTYRNILAAFPYIIRYKGSLHGIELIAKLFGRVMNTTVEVDQSKQDKNLVTIVFEGETPNVELLYDLLEYVRPTGMMVEYRINATLDDFADEYVSSDSIRIRTFKYVDLVTNKNQSSVVASSMKTEDNNLVLDSNWTVVSNVGFADTMRAGEQSKLEDIGEENNEG